jgi:hypothetical protein
MYANHVYIFGPVMSGKSLDDEINVKIGKSKNTDEHLDQRYKEHKRHCPTDVQLRVFDTNLTDDQVHEHLRNSVQRYFQAHTHNGPGRDVITLKVKHYAIYTHDWGKGFDMKLDFARRVV